ncbi:MAG: class E sortase [Actinomycetota bacterium]|nr:class E sortase [Actinomycetota bacterium]
MGCDLSAAPGRAVGPQREGNIRRATDSILNVMSLLLVGIGLAVALTFFAGSPARDAGAADNSEPVSQKSTARPEAAVVSPEVDKSLEKKTSEGKRKEAPRQPVVEGPEDEALKVTVPAMSRLQNTSVPYADGGNEAAFKRYAGVHLRGTGHPWEREANVYIAGHRLGYPGTDSFLAFWDLNRLENGDRIILTDADGKRYVYKVFREFVVEPTRVSVTQPLEGRNIVTLQTCTLPDYSRRLIVQAEKVA